MTNQVDDASKIYDQEVAKRVIEVAAVGGFSILFVATRGCQVSQLCSLAQRLTPARCNSKYFCPCGGRQDVERVCNCNEAAIRKHLRVIASHPAELKVVLQKSDPKYRLVQSGWTSRRAMTKRIRAGRLSPNPVVPEGLLRPLEAMIMADGVDAKLVSEKMKTLEAVAIAVCRLGRGEQLGLVHVMEAFNYCCAQFQTHKYEE